MSGHDDLKPGDMIGGRYELLGLLAYQGKEDCTSGLCRRAVYPDGSIGPCMGYHCPVCHEPCSMMGHSQCRPEGGENCP